MQPNHYASDEVRPQRATIVVNTGEGYFLQYYFNSDQLIASGGIIALHREARARGYVRVKRIPLRLSNGKWFGLYRPFRPAV